MRLICLIFLLLILNEKIVGQSDTASLKSDSVTTEKKSSGTLKNIFSGKPGLAFAYSIIPGGGQIYNKRWWKLPIVYSAYGVTFYLVDYNRKLYNRLDNAFHMRVDSMEKSKDEFINIYTSLSSLNAQRKFVDKNLQRSYLAIVGVFLLSGMEAFVDRHFMTFEVSDQLSLEIQPLINLQSSGISMALKW